MTEAVPLKRALIEAGVSPSLLPADGVSKCPLPLPTTREQRLVEEKKKKLIKL
jgi:hypothetical protein